MYDGRQIVFTIIGINATAAVAGTGSLVYTNQQWMYRDVNNDVYSFDSSSRLLEVVIHDGKKYSLVYTESDKDPGLVQVSDNRGNSLSFAQDAFYQPLSLSAPGFRVKYSYSSQALIGLVKSSQGLVSTRSYKYNFVGGVALLGAVTDERGILSATWEYDSQGRAVSSKNAGDVGKVTVSNSGSTTDVVNELGKSAKYSFITLNGVSMISSVEGEPSPNCPASNSSYTYDGMGHLLTKTDVKGFITTYTYNDRGLEVSRTEASGTPQARVTTTEWDPTRFLRIKVVESTRTTVYTYDDQGRETSRQLSAR
jgi:YD repeat-containing protein